MSSAAHAEHRAVHSGRHAAAPSGELKRLAFWVRTRYCTNTWMKWSESGAPKRNFAPVIVSANSTLQRSARTQKKCLTFQAWQDG